MLFSKKFASLLTTIQAWMIAVASVIWVLYSLYAVSDYYDFAEGVGAFVGLTIGGFFYLSIWYLVLFLIHKSVLK